MKIQIKITMPEWIEKILVRPILEYRRRRYGFAFRRIPLTMGLYALVDPEDYYALSKYDWFAVQSGATYYAMRNDFTGQKYSPVSMHRQVLPTEKGLVVDHRNGNGLDVRKANLRAITKAQNRFNSRKHVKASSKFKGVCWHKLRKKWTVTISKNGHRRCLGYFDDQIEAARAYDEAAKKYHGECARLNFPEHCETYEELCGTLRERVEKVSLRNIFL
ncbi:MAG: AP2 domain-containing protein [Sedimentisphaerales bacterium]